MHIHITVGLSEDFIDDFREQLGDSHTVTKASYSDSAFDEYIRTADILITGDGNIPVEKLNQANQLKLVQIPWIGVDRMDFAYFQKREIAVCNSKWNPVIVAEYALSLLLAGAKNLVNVDQSFRTGTWKTRASGSKQLQNSNVLLIGFGDIGQSLARYLQPFNCNITALKRNPHHSDLVHQVISWDQYAEYAATTDFIVMSLPLTKETAGIMNETRLRQLKKDVVLVNVGRGKTIVEEDLFNVIQEGHIFAALDVWYNYNTKRDPEPFYPSIFPFHELPNVIMSPHRASALVDGRKNFWDDVLFNIQAVETGTPLKNKISLEHGY